MKRIVVCLMVVFLLFTLPGMAGKEKAAKKDKMSADTFSGLKLRSIGPALMSGRISDIAIHPQDRGTWYIAVGSGGV